MFNLKARLQKTRDSFVAPLRNVFKHGERLSLEDQDVVEELLIGSDMGVEACDRIMDALKNQHETSDYQDFLRREFLDLLSENDDDPAEGTATPRAIIVIGVNGVGKTTSIAKLANYYKKNGKQVVLAAGDTFRAAAQEQLSLWAQRLDIEMIGHKQGGDPAAVAFDACTAAKSRNVDYVIIDTAGRLHTRVNLMEELKKIHRVCEKVLGPESVDAFLTLDATLGQNSLHQAKEFTRGIATRGIILTKLDSTAKGGIVIAIRQALGIPVSFIGAGEGVDDFAPFVAEDFVDALLSS
jgi:fused signal recognition particle receptor